MLSVFMYSMLPVLFVCLCAVCYLCCVCRCLNSWSAYTQPKPLRRRRCTPTSTLCYTLTHESSSMFSLWYDAFGVRKGGVEMSLSVSWSRLGYCVQPPRVHSVRLLPFVVFYFSLSLLFHQTFEDFKNDKQALEYQQRIVDILLKVLHTYLLAHFFWPTQCRCVCLWTSSCIDGLPDLVPNPLIC